MKITLERAELIHLISKSLGYSVEDHDVVIQAEPFEVSISNVRLIPSAGEDTTPAPQVEDNQEEDTVSDTLSMEDILSKNAAFGGPKMQRKNPPLGRPLGPYETEEPPEVTQDEISAVLRGHAR